MKNSVAFDPLQNVVVCSVVPFPYAMCWLNQVSQWNFEFIPSGGKVMPDVEP